MIKLYGSPVCTGCKQALLLLGKTYLEWQYVDVYQNKGVYEGEVPALQLETGQILIGLPAINQYVASMGFR